jgi:Fe-S-cluster containining protein
MIKLPEIWKMRDEVWAPADLPDLRIKIFDCLLFDSQVGRCGDYQHRPDFCRSYTCLYDSGLSAPAQIEKTRQAEFLKIIPIKRYQSK